jgi:hypothetical protein
MVRQCYTGVPSLHFNFLVRLRTLTQKEVGFGRCLTGAKLYTGREGFGQYLTGAKLYILGSGWGEYLVHA